MRSSFLILISLLASTSLSAVSDTTRTNVYPLLCLSDRMADYKDVLIQDQKTFDEIYEFWNHDFICDERKPSIDFSTYNAVFTGGKEYGCPSPSLYEVFAFVISDSDESNTVLVDFYIDVTCRGGIQEFQCVVAIPKNLSSVKSQVSILNSTIHKPPR